MNMSKVQTDNSYLETKVKLRLENLPAGTCNVLDCYAGTGHIWKIIKQRARKKKFNVIGIELKEKQGVYLQGDNRKFLSSMDLTRFNVIDLDAYGVPYHQLKILFTKRLRPGTVVFVTFIQILYGGLPHGMLSDIGYRLSMVKKCPALFYKNGFEKFKQFLAINGIGQIRHYSYQKKHYLCFKVKKEAHKD